MGKKITIRVQVQDEEGNMWMAPLEGVKVTLTGAKHKKIHKVVTDAEGKYEFPDGEDEDYYNATYSL